MKKFAFRDNCTGSVAENRVTLFRKKADGCGDVTLRPVARSGHITRESKTKFKIADNGDVTSGGIAGQAWISETRVVAYNLPLVNSSTGNKGLSTYAKKTFMPEAWVIARHYNARSFLAFRVSCRGEPWGVVVFDSINPASICLTAEAMDVIMRLSRVIESIVEGFDV